MRTMKKNLIRLFVCALSAACLLSLAACGGEKEPNESKTSSAPVSSATQSGAGTPASTAAGEDGLFANIEALMASEEMKSQLASTLDSMKSDDMDVTVTGEGNKLVYTFTYKDIGDMDLGELSDSLSDATETLGGTFETIASSLAATVKEANPTVVVIYKAPDGSELYNHEFSAK